MSGENGRSSLWRISQAIESMSSLSLGLVPSGGIAGSSNRISYCRYGAPTLEQATASIAGSARTIRQRLIAPRYREDSSASSRLCPLRATRGREAVGLRATAGPRRPTPSQWISPQAEHNASSASKRRSAPHRSHLVAAGALPSSPAVALSVSRCFHSEHHPSQSVHVCVRRRDFRHL